MRTQRDLRAEIRGVEMRLAAQGRSEFESGDYEKMPLLAAFIKVSPLISIQPAVR